MFYVVVKKYLFIWLYQVLAVAHGLSIYSTWAPEHAGSVVVTCRLSCLMTCEILVPGPGIEPTSPTLEGGFLTTGPLGKFQRDLLLMSAMGREVRNSITLLTNLTPLE